MITKNPGPFKMSTLSGEYNFDTKIERIVYGPGTVQRLSEEVKRLGGTRVLVITGNSIANKTNVLKEVVNSLGSLHAGTFHGIREHSHNSGINSAVDFAISLSADLFVSVGGGSPIDATKAVIKLLADRNGGNFLRHVALPTTLSAAEYTPGAGTTDDATRKKRSLFHPQMAVATIILDANLSLATPPQLWLSSGIRALDHAVETLYSPGFPRPVQDVLALEAIKALFKYLPLSKDDPNNIEVRQQLLVAAWLSMFKPPSMGLSHVLGRTIGSWYGVPHGITSCITLAKVVRASERENPEVREQFSRIGQALGRDADAADLIEELVKGLGLPNTLSEYGIKEENFHEIAVSTIGKEDGKEVVEVEELLKQML